MRFSFEPALSITTVSKFSRASRTFDTSRLTGTIATRSVPSPMARSIMAAAAEKLEIIRLVEQSWLSVKRTLAQLGIPRSTFYAWYERYLARGAEALEDGQPAPRRVWNKLPDTVAQAVVGLALKEPELSPRELAIAFADQQQYLAMPISLLELSERQIVI